MILLDDLDPEIREAYTAMRVLPDGRICGVHRLLFHWTMHIGIDHIGYTERYCFATRDMAERALAAWDGTGDPGNEWHRHPDSGRRRNMETGEIYLAD